MSLRLRILNIFLASLLFLVLKLFDLNHSVQQLNSDYLTNKKPQTQLQMEPLLQKVKQSRFTLKMFILSSVSDQILGAIFSC